MASFSQLLYLLLFVFIYFFFFSNFQLMDGTSDHKENTAANVGDGLLQLSWVEENGDGRETLVKKVSGEDDMGEMRTLIVEKFRVLLGMESSNTGTPTSARVEEEVSPAPAPIEAKEPVPPAPAPSFPIHVHSHSRAPHLIQIPPPHNLAVRRRDKPKARSRRIVIAVLVSIGATFAAIVALVVILVWHRFGRTRRKRPTRTVQVYGICGGSGRSKLSNPLNPINKVSFDPAPELFYLNTLGPLAELPCSKQNCETMDVLWNEDTPNTLLHDAGESSREPARSEPDRVNCSLPDIIQSSDDESFHSICDSHSSNRQPSDVSEGHFSTHSANCSPLYASETCPSPSNSLAVSTLSFPPKSPTPPETWDSAPVSLNLQSPSCFPNSLKRTKPTALSFSSCSQERLPNSPPVSSLSHPDPTMLVVDDPSISQAATPPATADFVPLSPSSVQPPPSSASSLAQMPVVAPDSNNANSMAQISSMGTNSDSSSSMRTRSTPVPPLQKPNESLSSPPGVPPQPVKVASPGSTPPPPPCPPLPPPFIKVGSSIKPPPPPPCQATAIGKNGSPLPKLKPLHWDKVRAAPDSSMVWDKLRSSSFELDEEMIESLFGYNLQTSTKNEDVKSKIPSPSKHVLDTKRLQNITILSKALNATTEQICAALMQGNGLCIQQLEALTKMFPTKEEEEKLSNYQGDTNELGSAEKFVKAMLNIPFAFQRIEAMLYRETFEDEVIHLRKSFAMLEAACKELRSSRLFLKLLEAVLKTGNRMNVGTIRGGARAFKLDALLKLSDVKATDGKTTLLHFVVQEMIRSEGVRVSEMAVEKNSQNIKHKTVEEREEDYRIMDLDLVSGLSNELCNVKKTATIDLDVLASSVSNLSDGMVKLQHLVEENLSPGDGSFAHSMKFFLTHAGWQIKELAENEGRVLLHVREITEYFHGNVGKDEPNPLRIFVIVRDFLGMLDKVCKEVRSSKPDNVPNANIFFR